MPKHQTDDSLPQLQGTIDFFKSNEDQLINEPTFFEIAGFPSRENVFSNFLKFYFNSKEKHLLGTRVLEALLHSIPGIDLGGLETKYVKREVVTKKQNRIDLIIETDGYVIAIENKVYHIINNDLADYSDYLAQQHN